MIESLTHTTYTWVSIVILAILIIQCGTLDMSSGMEKIMVVKVQQILLYRDYEFTMGLDNAIRDSGIGDISKVLGKIMDNSLYFHLARTIGSKCEKNIKKLMINE